MGLNELMFWAYQKLCLILFGESEMKTNVST